MSKSCLFRNWITRVVIAAFLGLAASSALTQPKLESVPTLQARVTDLTGTLNSEQRASLDQQLRTLEERKGAQLAVLIVSTTQPDSIEQYGLRVVEQWKLGRRKMDDGVLVLVAKEDRRVRIEVGYGLEGALSDLATNRIINEQIKPRFRQGDFAGGIEAGVNQISKLIEAEPLAAPNEKKANFDQDFSQAWPGLIIVALVFGRILQRMIGRLPSAVVVGGIIGIVAWLAMNSLVWALIAALVGFFMALSGIIGFIRGLGGRGVGGGGFGGGGGGFGGGGSSGRW